MQETLEDLNPDVREVLGEADQLAQDGRVVAAVTRLCGAYAALAPVDAEGSRAVEDRARSLLADLGSNGFDDLMDLDAERRSAVLEGIVEAHSRLRSGWLRSAEDAYLVSIERVPEYLPAQIMLADVYVRAGNRERAAEKYQWLMDLYCLRDRKRGAIEVLRRALSLSPDDEQKRQRLISWMIDEGLVDQALREMTVVARAYLEKGEIDAGLRLYDLMVEQAPNNAGLHLDYGTVLEGLGRRPEALFHYGRSRELEPNRPESGRRIIRCKILDGTWDGLESDLDLLMDLIEPSSGVAVGMAQDLKLMLEGPVVNQMARLCLGILLARMGEWSEAQEHVQAALVDGDEMPLALQLAARLMLGRALLGGGQAEKAAALLSDGLEPVRDGYVGGLVAEAKVRSYLRVLREAYERQQDARGLLWVLKETKAILPDEVGLGRVLARLHFDLGQNESGVAALLEVADGHRVRGDLQAELDVLRDCADRVPDDVVVRTRLCDTFIELGQLEESRREIEWLAEAHKSKGDLVEAARSLRRLLEISPELDRLQGMALREEILRLNPFDSGTRLELAEACLWTGQASKALAFALETAPQLARAADVPSTIRALSLVVKIDPWNVSALEQLGDMLYDTGQRDESLLVFERLRLLNPEHELATRRIAELGR
ncbi:MAG: hypothetical protein M1358_22710 [Chloroflexi bacterium]|nr:hypothetical protein [Chloroflexota bacterium]